MIHGETYYSVHEEDKKYVVRRHYWDDHSFDHKMIQERNCYTLKSNAERQAERLNNESKYLIVTEENTVYKGDFKVIVYLQTGSLSLEQAKRVAEIIEVALKPIPVQTLTPH
jgi:hypothetical protein